MTELSSISTMALLGTTLLLQIATIKGAFFRPIGYTFPSGLQSVNGSSSTGGCQPEGCVVMPFSGATINGCDCPGSGPASGVLTDGVIPSIDTTQHGTWANELFVVNRNAQDSFMIGFQFSNFLALRYVEAEYLDCAIWGTGWSNVNVYSSSIFPSFLDVASTSIGMLSLGNDFNWSCTSLRTLSIPLQPTTPMEIYFIEFTFGGTDAHPINWLHLAEIRFSDVAPTTSTPIGTMARTSDQTTTMPISSRGNKELPTTSANDNAGTSLSTTDSDQRLPMTQEHLSDNASSGAELENYTSVSTSTDVPVPGTSIAAISVPVFVGTLVGVIALLILLSAGAFIILSCAYLKKYKMKQNQAEKENGYDYVIERGVEINETRNPIEMKMNEAYGTCRQADNQENTTDYESQAVETHYEEVH